MRVLEEDKKTKESPRNFKGTIYLLQEGCELGFRLESLDRIHCFWSVVTINPVVFG